MIHMIYALKMRHPMMTSGDVDIFIIGVIIVNDDKNINKKMVFLLKYFSCFCFWQIRYMFI